MNITEVDILDFACKEGHLQIFQYLIEKGAKDIDYQQTPLHIACSEGNLPVVEYLIEKGVNIEAKDFQGKTPLHWASEFGHTAIVKFIYLISKGARTQERNEYFIG